MRGIRSTIFVEQIECLDTAIGSIMRGSSSVTRYIGVRRLKCVYDPHLE